MVAKSELALVREAVRLYRRYAVEIVEALGFCPYAVKSREDGHTREIVLTEEAPSDDDVLGAIEQLAADEKVEVGFVILPRVTILRSGLGRWVEHLRKAHARAHDGAATMAIEGFHPEADPDPSTAERLTPFVRRTPDPTLQITRLAVLDRIRRGSPQGTAFFDPSSMDLSALLAEPERAPLHARIAEKNLETCQKLGLDAVRARMDDILRDRDAAYARIDPSIAPRGKR
jgi:hypothetical protein